MRTPQRHAQAILGLGVVSSSYANMAVGASEGARGCLYSVVREKQMVWDDRPRSLRDLVTSHRLPITVKACAGDVTKPLGSITPGEVLQVEETRRRKIILARRMVWDKRLNDYVVTGDQLEIPASFKDDEEHSPGWFEVVPDDGRPVEYFDSVGGVTSIKPRKFLVRTSTVGYQLSVEDGASCWMPYEILPGEVLTTGMIFMDNKKTKSKSFFKKILKPNKSPKKDQDLKYLQCFDSQGKEIMIPLIMSGVFSPIGDASLANYDAVYELQDLIMAFGLPVNAQLIYTNPKEKQTCPGGVLRFYGTREEEYALVTRKPMPGNDPSPQEEIPLDSELRFIRGVNKHRKVNKEADSPAAATTQSSITTISTPTPTSNSSSPSAGMTTPTTPTTTALGDEAKKKTEVVIPAYSCSVELPQREASKDSKKSRSGFLDKLSVRKAKKERAKLKALKEDDVFSKRLSRSELTYEDFFNGLDADDESDDCSDVKSPVPQKSPDVQTPSTPSSADGGYVSKKTLDDTPVTRQASEESPYASKKEAKESGGTKSRWSKLYGKFKEGKDNQSPYGSAKGKKENPYGQAKEPALPPRKESVDAGYSTGHDSSYMSVPKPHIQNRDLPPIPSEATNHHGDFETDDESKDSLYEHLPPAPKPPSHAAPREGRLREMDCDGDSDDGYMVPLALREGMESPYTAGTDALLRRKPPSAPREATRLDRIRRVHSEGTTGEHDLKENIDLDTLFDFGDEDSGGSEDRRRLYTKFGGLSRSGPSRCLSTTQLYGMAGSGGGGKSRVPKWRENIPDVSNAGAGRFTDDFDLEPRGKGGNLRGKSRSQRNLFMDPNATVRSHNLRQNRNVMEVFHFTDSFRDLRDDIPLGGAAGQGGGDYAHSGGYGSSAGYGEMPSPWEGLGEPNSSGYYSSTGSALLPRAYSRSVSGGALSDTYGAKGDDSAISLCSRGEYGSAAGSEYSYWSYSVGQGEEGYVPPEKLQGLSVQEVSQALRYIGMKDRVVLRFANEQIDGDMLLTLDRKLLKEGFPELNALEVKKIVDFIGGWRPKKR